ncbi:hypothetical protein H012_gp803 [Acanthamoeba polyphaga moumouvirus]|uniref:Uncharacterized protein n=2 Tax=Moumouvirus TaxID=3080801 RepID=L7RBT3_9VIRU|nr:hypothetical protein H012_gp803 [Acanthamoeba polyphaga moumouvirus]AEX63184.1 hypothetical protein mv_L982 [Moumouvirus Monve]AGC01662.1 hypothetical protein Moumou_00118 [Acanthamoeba polyphaga moumouvirus]AQN67999.1 hypothetical protein [Saudi moumouvirus]
MGNLYSSHEEINRNKCIANNLLPIDTNNSIINSKIFNILKKHKIKYENIHMYENIYFLCPTSYDHNIKQIHKVNWKNNKCPFIKLILPTGYYFQKDYQNHRYYNLFDDKDNMIFKIYIKMCGYDNFSYCPVDNTHLKYKDNFCDHENYAKIVKMFIK